MHLLDTRTLPVRSGFSRRLMVTLVGMAVAVLPALAVNRTLALVAPATAGAGSTVNLYATASTDAKDGEQIGFFHAEYSVDSGKTWKGVCFDSNVGTSATRDATVKVGAAGTTTLFRVRVAFRVPGRDMDYSGKPIAWDGSWKSWQEPPAKLAKITVTASAADTGKK